MNNLFDNLGGLAGIGILTAGIGFAYAQFGSGTGKSKDDLIQTLRDTVVAEKERAERLSQEKATLVNSHQTQLNELNNKLGKLQGLYEAAETSKKEYLAVLQGRDPAQQKFMELMTNAVTSSSQMTNDATAYMNNSIEILKEIRTFMESLNKTSTANVKFLNEVVEDTAHDEGKVLKKKV